MSILLTDGVKYQEWAPPSEGEFERMVEEHAKDIFGEESIYLEKHKLRTKSGIGSIPDGYVIIVGNQPQWHIVEVELSTHPLYEHIVPQISKFINGIKNPSTQRDIVDTLYREIDSDDFLKLRLKKAMGTTETYKFLSDLISKPPVVTIIIEKRTEQLDEAISALAHPQIKIVEFQTLTRERVGLAVHAHLFEPLHAPEKTEEQIPPTPTLPIEETELTILEHTLRNDEIKYKRFKIVKDEKSFFPPSGSKFQIKADGDTYTTMVTDEEPPRMRYLKPWFKQHSDLKPGDKVVFRRLGSNLYQLTRA